MRIPSKSTLGNLIYAVDKGFSHVKFRFKQQLNWLDPVQVLPYRGFGTPQKVCLKGRVLEKKGITGAGEYDTVWQNLVRMYHRFDSDEIPGAKVRIRFQAAEMQVKANYEGFFQANLQPEQPPDSTQLWHNVHTELLEPQVPDQSQPVTSTGHILIPPKQAQFGVISDVDDTVLQTEATNWLTMARIVLFSNAHTRLPFEGVSHFYQALQRGNGQGKNPIFYVSSSPWNLYDLLVDFFRIQQIPIGPLFLQDYGIDANQLFFMSHRKHKLTQIERILETYPQLPFILIGDSGQKDPEIYREVVQQYPGRILAIYIRDVSLDERQQEVETIAQGLGQHGVEMLLVQDTYLAQQHAAANGFILR